MAPYMVNERPVVLAVDSRGEVAASIVLHPYLVAADVKRYLAGLLDTVDPVALHLMSGDDAAPAENGPVRPPAARKGRR